MKTLLSILTSKGSQKASRQDFKHRAKKFLLAEVLWAHTYTAAAAFYDCFRGPRLDWALTLLSLMLLHISIINSRGPKGWAHTLPAPKSYAADIKILGVPRGRAHT